MWLRSETHTGLGFVPVFKIGLATGQVKKKNSLTSSEANNPKHKKIQRQKTGKNTVNGLV